MTKTADELCGTCGHEKSDHHNATEFCCEIAEAGLYCERDDCNCEDFTRVTQPPAPDVDMVAQVQELLELACGTDGGYRPTSGNEPRLDTLIAAFVSERVADAVRWIKVSERLPPDGPDKDYLVTQRGGLVQEICFQRGEWVTDFPQDSIIAWMPLPPPCVAESEPTEPTED